MLEAIFQTDRDRRWIKFLPEFRVLPSVRQVAAEEWREAREPLSASASPEAREKLRLAAERRRALLEFRHPFPLEIGRHVGRVPNQQWWILQLLRHWRNIRVLHPERATLSLIQAEAGAWEIGQLKASRNQSVTEQTIDLVEQWLCDWRFSCHH